MKELKEKVNMCLKSLTELKKAKEELKEDEKSLNDFNSICLSLIESFYAQNKVAGLVVKALAAAEAPNEGVGDEALLTKCQEESLEIYGDWTEEAVQVAVMSYVLQGGEFTLSEEESVKMVPLESFYGLTESMGDSEYTQKEFESLPETVFAGENKTFPVYNLESALLAVKTLESLEEKEDTTNKVFEASAKYGIVKTENGVGFTPIQIESVGSDSKVTKYVPFVLNTEAEFKEFSDNIDLLAETYSISNDIKEKILSFSNNIKEKIIENKEYSPLLVKESEFDSPVVLTNEFLLSYFTKHEAQNTEKESLMKLVGAVRKLGISNESLEENAKPYSVFGTSVLKKLMLKPVEGKAEETPKVDVVAQPNSEESSKAKETNKPETILEVFEKTHFSSFKNSKKKKLGETK
jgi:hypothetical protein